MRHLIKALAILALAVLVLPAVQAQQQVIQVVRINTGEASIVTDPDTDKAKLASCQPLKNERADVMEFKAVYGVTMARVVVTEGRCKGTAGWISSVRFDAVN